MKFTFLMENKTYKSGLLAEHGLSLLIETKGHNLLFDAGATGAFVSNCVKMGIDLEKVDMAVISHGHYDHTGGFPEFCRINAKAPVFMHRNALRTSYGMENGELEKETSGIRWTDEELKKMASRIVFTDGVLKLDDNIYLTGTVPVDEDFIPTEKFYYKETTPEGEKIIEDDMSHEQCLVIKEAGGIFIFSGCSHRGVINAINVCKSIFPGEPVRALVAGMHLYSSPREAGEKVVEQVARENIEKLFPVHCTGIEGISMLKTAAGDRCIIAGAGDEYEF